MELAVCDETDVSFGGFMPHRTCLHQMLHGGKPLVDGSADRAIDEHTREVDISHQGSSG